jgi:deazaflavin-dependent oxidoreductase (nitroreductase family)
LALAPGAAKMRGVNPLLKLFVAGHVRLYQSSGGRWGGTMSGRKILLLTTTGNKSGKSRTVPVVPFFDGETYVIASMGGAPEHPSWYRNLRANPDVGVQIGADQWRARAVAVEDGPERQRLWAQIVQQMPNFGKYQEKTSRLIPVVRLARQP